MPHKHFLTEEEKAELLCNPYTAYVSDCRIYFTVAFKKFVLENIDKPAMNSTKVFELAGYRKDLFSGNTRKSYVRRFRAEAASPQGLKEPTAPKQKKLSSTKNADAEIKELKDRIELLEQQIQFLKKSQHLKNHPVERRHNSS